MSQMSWEPYLDWENINTDSVRDWSDERLLEVAKGCEVAFGYGVIAEICKRLKERAHE